MIRSFSISRENLKKSLAKILGPTNFRKLRNILIPSRKYNEVDAVYRALGKDRANRGYMIDVGGHYGESFKDFAAQGWYVDCFEPNPEHHAAIQSIISTLQGQVRLFPQAVSDVKGEKLTLYVSELSSGISSLHPFHSSHRKGAIVETIRLRDHLSERGITKVDFLKIDTEGFDFFVLKGIDWTLVKPEIIVCEFEDRKTRGLGYSYKDMAYYLVERGYEVIVSEWHPIKEYGKTHNWHRYTKFPSELSVEQAWGNLIAFQPGTGGELLKEQLRKLGKVD